jgi:tetratricopeptide (TPR) repeat protein
MFPTITEALRRGDAPAALAAARSAVAAEPDNAQAQHLLGLSLHKSGDLPGARDALDRAIALAPTNALFHFSRGSVELGADGDAARAQLQQAVSLNPNQREAYVALVHLALARGDRDEAARQLKLAERVDAEAVDVRLAAGSLAQAEGDTDLALREFAAAAEQDPDNPFAQLSLGLAYLERGSFAFAEQALKNTLRLQPDNASVVRALVQCQLDSNDSDAALATLEDWLRAHPGDALLNQRARVHGLRQREDLALADFVARLGADPTDPIALRGALSPLVATRQNDAAVSLAESALAADPQDDELWQIRLNLVARNPEQARAVLARWLAARPDSAQAWDRQAQVQEMLGELDAAEASADAAIKFGSQRLTSHLVRFRGRLRRDPALALAELDALIAQTTAPEMRSVLAASRGLVLDRLRRYDQAALSWRDKNAQENRADLLPAPQRADLAPKGNAAGTLLWTPAGVPAERVFAALQPLLGARLCLDRVRSARGDGFDQQRPLAGGPEAGSAESWRRALAARGQASEDVIDWLPFWDGYTAGALSGARVVALLTDPRDAFLHWMVFGSLAGYPFLADAAACADWLAQSLDAFTVHLDAQPENAGVVLIDEIETRPAAVAGALKTALALPAAPDPALLAQSRHGLGGVPLQFPAGHWRHYQQAFAGEFARLTPVAQRLGYSAD